MRTPVAYGWNVEDGWSSGPKKPYELYTYRSCPLRASKTAAAGTRLDGFDCDTPIDGVAVKLSTSGGFVSGARVRLTQSVSPETGSALASPAAWPVAVARTVCGAATVQTS